MWQQSNPTLVLQLLASLIGGGLSGGVVTTVLNRFFHRRALRTQFFPKVNDVLGEYLMRFIHEEGWFLVAGKDWSTEDKAFADHRATFLHDLVIFTELKEARQLRSALLENAVKEERVSDKLCRIDLRPEMKSLSVCLKTLEKKLKLGKVKLGDVEHSATIVHCGS